MGIFTVSVRAEHQMGFVFFCFFCILGWLWCEDPWLFVIGAYLWDSNWRALLLFSVDVQNVPVHLSVQMLLFVYWCHPVRRESSYRENVWMSPVKTIKYSDLISVAHFRDFHQLTYHRIYLYSTVHSLLHTKPARVRINDYTGADKTELLLKDKPGLLGGTDKTGLGNKGTFIKLCVEPFE